MTVANCCASPTHSALRDELGELVIECAPRRFAVCWLDPVEDDGGVLAWGLALAGGKAVVIDGDGGMRGAFRSAESARRFVGRGRGDLVLVWLDPEHA
jgi:hypothetical protein